MYFNEVMPTIQDVALNTDLHMKKIQNVAVEDYERVLNNAGHVIRRLTRKVKSYLTILSTGFLPLAYRRCGPL